MQCQLTGKLNCSRGRKWEKGDGRDSARQLRISLESRYMSYDIVNRVNLSCDGLNYRKSYCNHSTAWNHTQTPPTHTATHSQARQLGDTFGMPKWQPAAVPGTCAQFPPSDPHFVWFICALLHTTLTPSHTHARTLAHWPRLLYSEQEKKEKKYWWQALPGFPAYIIYANISPGSPAVGSLIRKILTDHPAPSRCH